MTSGAPTIMVCFVSIPSPRVRPVRSIKKKLGRCFHSKARQILRVESAVSMPSSIKCLPTPSSKGMDNVHIPATRQFHLYRCAIRAVAIAVSIGHINNAPRISIDEGGVVPNTCVTMPHQAPITPANKGGYSP